MSLVAMRVSPINLKILAYALDLEGFDSAQALQPCGYASIDDVAEDGDWLSVAVFDRLMAEAQTLTGDPSFGLVVGKSLALMRYGHIARVAMVSPDLRQLLDDLRRYAPLMIEHSEIELEEDSRGARLLVRPVTHGGLSGRFRMEQVATSAAQMLRFVGAETSDLLRVEFPYDLPDGQERRYVATFGPRIEFGCKRCTVHFTPSLLDRALASHDLVGYTSARTRAESLLAAMQAGTDLADRVRQCLFNAFPQLPTVPETASQLGLSERSFRRQLAQLGTSHADLTQECQRLTVERLLAEGQLPLKQIAEAVGFGSVHSFHRAFRRWSGLTPSAWRESRGEPPLT
jgi:AraC-like DNA-binding protein